MKDLKLTALAITTTALIASNLIVGKQYVDDSKQYESKIHSQYKIIERYNKESKSQKQLINHKVDEINQKGNEINNLNTQLDQLKKENDDLKKQLQVREEMKKQYFVVTFYTNGYESTQKKIGDEGYGITASGTKATEGRTIAAPPSIPFGTKVYIQGIGTRIVEDRGNAVNGNHIDVFVESVSKAKELGKQTLLVEILD